MEKYNRGSRACSAKILLRRLVVPSSRHPRCYRRHNLRCHRPAWPGDPVRRGGRDWTERPRRTGFPAYAGN